MKEITPEIEKICSTVVYSSTRPGMYTDNGSIVEIVNFWYGIEHALFYPNRETPLKLFCDVVIQATDQYPFVVWTHVIQEHYLEFREPKRWFENFLADFQKFCIDQYGKDFCNQYDKPKNA